jgi:predicted nucleic acid-binding Zn ribbon protein
VPIIFKGSGFYTTDSRGPEPKASGDGQEKTVTESKETVAAASED